MVNGQICAGTTPTSSTSTSPLPAAGFEAIRTERVLMYLPDPDFERVVDALIGLLRPAGRLVLFELDYGATILPEAGHGADMVRRAHAILERSAVASSA